MPFVHVLALAGASDDQKRRLVAGVTDAICRAYAIAPDIVTVYLNEIPLANYGHGGHAGAATTTRRPFLVVHALPRPIEKRRVLVREVTRAAAAALGLADDLPAVYVLETPKDTMAHGGVLTSDLEGAG